MRYIQHLGNCCCPIPNSNEPIINDNVHDWVEIGGIKWATMNVGATTETDAGLYFQWGDTQGYTALQCGNEEGQKYFGFEDYKHGNGTRDPESSGMTKYNNIDGKTVLEISDDAVIANWGDSWRMPTREEFNTLLSATNNEWTTINGVNGMLFTDKTDDSKKLFFPAVGACENGNVSYEGFIGVYWLSSLYTSNITCGWDFFFDNKNCDMGNGLRRAGFPIRGVLD